MADNESTEEESFDPMPLASVVQILDNWLHPAYVLPQDKFARDSLGLISPPELPLLSIVIHKIFVCNDLTSNVYEEAIKKKANLIVTNHTPTLVSDVYKCYHDKIALYSANSSLASVPGGIDDAFVWEFGFGRSSDYTTAVPVDPAARMYGSKVRCFYNEATEIFKILNQHRDFNAAADIPTVFDKDSVKHSRLPKIAYPGHEYGDGRPLGPDKLRYVRVNTYCYNQERLNQFEVQVLNLLGGRKSLPFYECGFGRIVRFSKEAEECKPALAPTLALVIAKTKAILNLESLQLVCGAAGLEDKIYSVAFASGTQPVGFWRTVDAEVIITGQMCHRDVLCCIEHHITVLLCGEASTEIPYIEKLASILQMKLKVDKGPPVVYSEEERHIFMQV